MNPTLYIIIGETGSGKSTLASKLNPIGARGFSYLGDYKYLSQLKDIKASEVICLCMNKTTAAEIYNETIKIFKEDFPVYTIVKLEIEVVN